jgi:hypothetical protein
MGVLQQLLDLLTRTARCEQELEELAPQHSALILIGEVLGEVCSHSSKRGAGFSGQPLAVGLECSTLQLQAQLPGNVLCRCVQEVGQ